MCLQRLFSNMATGNDFSKCVRTDNSKAEKFFCRTIQAFREFVYESDADGNGIIAAIGSKSIKIEHNATIQENSVYALVSGKRVGCIIAETPGSYFIINFKPHEISPTHFTLMINRYDCSSDEPLQDWDFFGSKDGKKWTTLKSHKPKRSVTWQVDNEVISKHDYYSYFKLLMTGKYNNSGGAICCAGLEIYGKLLAENINNGRIPAYSKSLNASFVDCYINENIGYRD
eukprot:265472_1